MHRTPQEHPPQDTRCRKPHAAAHRNRLGMPHLQTQPGKQPLEQAANRPDDQQEAVHAAPRRRAGQQQPGVAKGEAQGHKANSSDHQHGGRYCQGPQKRHQEAFTPAQSMMITASSPMLPIACGSKSKSLRFSRSSVPKPTRLAPIFSTSSPPTKGKVTSLVTPCIVKSPVTS